MMRTFTLLYDHDAVGLWSLHPGWPRRHHRAHARRRCGSGLQPVEPRGQWLVVQNRCGTQHGGDDAGRGKAWGDTTWCNASDRNSAFFGPNDGFLKLHPGLVANTVLRWTAPADGRYLVQLSSRKEDTGGGDSVTKRASIGTPSARPPRRSRSTRAPKYSDHFDWTLQLGDTVSAEVTQLSDGYYDSTGLRFVVQRQE